MLLLFRVHAVSGLGLVRGFRDQIWDEEVYGLGFSQAARAASLRSPASVYGVLYAFDRAEAGCLRFRVTFKILFLPFSKRFFFFFWLESCRNVFHYKTRKCSSPLSRVVQAEGVAVPYYSYLQHLKFVFDVAENGCFKVSPQVAERLQPSQQQSHT